MPKRFIFLLLTLRVGGGHWNNRRMFYTYATSSIHIVSVIIRHITGIELLEYIHQRLAEPMGWGIKNGLMILKILRSKNNPIGIKYR